MGAILQSLEDTKESNTDHILKLGAYIITDILGRLEDQVGNISKSVAAVSTKEGGSVQKSKGYSQ